MQTSGKQQDTTFILPQKQDTIFSPRPPKKRVGWKTCEMAVQHINYLACSRKKRYSKNKFYTTDTKYFQKVAQHQGHSISIPLWLSQMLCLWKNVKPAIYVAPPKLHWISTVGKCCFVPRTEQKEPHPGTQLGAEKITSVLEGAETKTQDFLKQEFPQGWGKKPLLNIFWLSFKTHLKLLFIQYVNFSHFFRCLNKAWISTMSKAQKNFTSWHFREARVSLSTGSWHSSFEESRLY